MAKPIIRIDLRGENLTNPFAAISITRDRFVQHNNLSPNTITVTLDQFLHLIKTAGLGQLEVDPAIAQVRIEGMLLEIGED